MIINNDEYMNEVFYADDSGQKLIYNFTYVWST